LTKEFELLEEQVNREIEWLDKKMIHESDSNSKSISDLSSESNDYDEESKDSSKDMLREKKRE